MLGFGIAVLVHLGHIVLGFYGFWLVWRCCCRWLPGPPQPGERIASFAGYFTDPLTAPLVGLLGQCGSREPFVVQPFRR